MKVLVLSDLHYPFVDVRMILKIINTLKPNKVIFLGDNIVSKGSIKNFNLFLKKLRCEYVILNGDEDVVKFKNDFYKLNLGKKTFVFTHGHLFQPMSDDTAVKLVKPFQRINDDSPLLIFSIVCRLRQLLWAEYLILGHAHALRAFPRLRTFYAGTLTELKNIYNDKGFLAIDDKGITGFKLITNKNKRFSMKKAFEYNL